MVPAGAGNFGRIENEEKLSNPKGPGAEWLLDDAFAGTRDCVPFARPNTAIPAGETIDAFLRPKIPARKLAAPAKRFHPLPASLHLKNLRAVPCNKCCKPPRRRPGKT
jgi:hypothetical protein